MTVRDADLLSLRTFLSEYHSMEEISAFIGYSQNCAWRWMTKLKRTGMIIEIRKVGREPREYRVIGKRR